jgi:hypothetical protein
VKRVIERLESARKVFNSFKDVIPRDPRRLIYRVACDLLDRAIAELRRNMDDYRRVKCDWCGSAFYEDYIRDNDGEKQCPVCGEKGYLTDIPEEGK